MKDRVQFIRGLMKWNGDKMRKATRIVATSLGILAGLAGLKHGIFEFIQGDIHPSNLMFPSIGSPCIPDKAWNACEPAMMILPNFFAAGILTIIVSILILVWTAGFVFYNEDGRILILLSIVLLLVGGGFFPPIIGWVGSVAAIQTKKPLDKAPGKFTRFAATLWPWPLIILIVWLLGQFPIGYFFNDFLRNFMGFGLLLILITLPFSVYVGSAYDTLRPPI